MKALLSCGVVVDIEIKEGSGIVEFTIQPPDGTKIEDTLYIRDGAMKVYMTAESVADFYELLSMLVSQPKKKSWFDKLFQGRIK